MNLAVILVSALFAIDGDTVRTGEGETIRIENIDAPESGARARCDAERFLAVHARKALERWLQRQPVVIQRSGSRDRYGRTLARIRAGGVDVGESLMGEALAWRWEGRRHDWCAAK